MGWASGSYLANDIWDAVRRNLKPGAKKRVAKKIVAILEDNDWDTQDEAPALMEAAGGPDWRRDYGLIDE